LDGAYKSHVVVQPVVRLDDGSVVGGELLLRPPGGTAPRAYLGGLDRPDRLHLERALQRAVLAAARRLSVTAGRHRKTYLLHYNLDPRIVCRNGRFDWPLLARADAVPVIVRIVLEVSERVPLRPEHRALLRRLRRHGFLIAVDDAGSGWSSPTAVARLRPDFIKIDRSVVKRVEADPRRRSVVRALVGLAGDVRAEVVAEGVETEAAARVLRDLGVAYGQGALFGLEAARWSLEEFYLEEDGP